MARIRHSLKIFLTNAARLAALILVINMVACSGSRQQVPISGLDTGDNSDLFSDSTTDTTSDGSLTFDENLFDTQVGTDPSNGGVTNLNDPTATEQECLTSNAGVGLNGFDVGTGQNTANPACFQTLPTNGQTQGMDPQMSAFFNAFQSNQVPQFMLNASASSFGLMDRCVQMANMVPQFLGVNQNSDWREVFKIVQLGMVRCFRTINSWQQSSVPWAYAQQNAFSHTDRNLYNISVNFENHD